MKWRADHIHCASHACQMMADHFVLGLTWSVGLSLRRHSVCPTLSVSSLCVTSSPCPTSSTCPQSACLCVFVVVFFVLCARHHVLPWFELFSMCLWEFFYFLNWFDAPPQATYDASSLCPDWIDLHVKINYSLTDRRRVLQHLAAMLPSPCNGMHYQCISHDSSVLFFWIEDHNKLTQQSRTRTSMHSHLCLQPHVT